ncbi:Lrp/AsnC family transcriptional regulator [Desulfosarcina sp.]|uniref:Lrp/AsnC family transcriptional regulator n=1 Tax=Desulfosarcina sp. TaxID=2027861 RepID=UPI0029B37864|nr:Lrp/AsnC family transcriptional regulator [Desulfosarcina sp.]MDX2451307.1 Lrp/AsnC family transcriptional regulator [Desulfosarcina sp.]MDX2489130.1 Lrp/AsnC family transcriptional regulator [Desulfosarcina sp.]
MDLQIEKLLDRIGRKILSALQENARIPLSRIGEKVGLSAPAVAERVKKLEEAGVITGYHARIDPSAMGRSVSAFIHLTTDARHYPAVKSLAADLPQISACHHISGDASFILHIRADDLSTLETVVGRLSPLGQTRTTIVLSTPVDKTTMVPLL